MGGESPIEVFDPTFIADNLYAGEKIDLEHDRSLFTIILGREGVKLARQQEFFNAAAKRTATKVKDTEAALSDDVPSDMTLDEFLGHSAPSSIDDQIEVGRKQLNTVLQAGRMATLRLLEPVAVPALAVNVSSILAATVPDIQTTTRQQLAIHFRKHKLGREGEEWVRFGRDHIVDDDCPFCGRQGVDELGLVTLYDKIFGESYQKHLELVRDTADVVDAALGSEARETIARIVSANSEHIRAWSAFCKLDDVSVPDIELALLGMAKVHDRLAPLLESKRQTPLAVIDVGQAVDAAKKDLLAAIAIVQSYNEAVEAINGRANKARSSPQPTEQLARQRLENLSKRKRRPELGVQARIDAMLAARRRDARAKKLRTEVQGRLKKANETAAAHYHKRVNFYLDRFGVTFRISEISNSMAGNLGSVDYGLIVRGHAINRGRKEAMEDEPTFRNTLSTGDKTTLAFAFFLAGLDRDADLSKKVIVFDDPMSSHDTHRQGRTIEFLNEVGGRCAQLIIMSHDAFFLRQVSKRCSTIEQTCFEIHFEGPENWSRASVASLDELCRSDHALLVHELQTYYSERKGKPTDVAPAVRKVLETHYRSAYAAYFDRNDNLGIIIKKIREEGRQHACYADLPDLESCNAATSDEHHGGDPAVAPSLPIDQDDLHLVVRDCLQLIGALRRPLGEISPTTITETIITASTVA
jgi:wobble nucleotide-excising tRNase